MAVHVTDLNLLRDQLMVRREKLETAAARQGTAGLLQLLEQVDQALERMDNGSFGVCEACKGTVEAERLLSDPLARFCLDCLRPAEQRALEEDLELARRIQTALLPAPNLSAIGWNVSYYYQPAGVVSGDYCDLIHQGNDLYFMVGDVSGKGVAASMSMANLHAMFRALVPAGLALSELVQRANRIFSESTLPTQYATLVCGKASACGAVEICNSGHPRPFHVSSSGVVPLDPSALPLGMFHDQEFECASFQVSPGDALVIYTDGFSDAVDPEGREYGAGRLQNLLRGVHGRHARHLVERCNGDLAAFSAGSSRLDDQTLMALQFAPVQN